MKVPTPYYENYRLLTQTCCPCIFAESQLSTLTPNVLVVCQTKIPNLFGSQSSTAQLIYNSVQPAILSHIHLICGMVVEYLSDTWCDVNGQALCNGHETIRANANKSVKEIG